MSRPPTVMTGSVEDDSADATALPTTSDGRPPPPARGDAVGSPTSRAATRQRRRLLLVGAVIAAAFVFLVVKGLGSSLDYFETVDQAISQKAALGTKTIRLEGLVVPGTVQKTRDGVNFVAAGTHDRIAVTNTGNPPQLFQPDIPVVVVGHFDGSTFVSSQIIVDHTSQYIEQHPTRVKAPNGTVR